jgi:hypothetical protein
MFGLSTWLNLKMLNLVAHHTDLYIWVQCLVKPKNTGSGSSSDPSIYIWAQKDAGSGSSPDLYMLELNAWLNLKILNLVIY